MLLNIINRDQQEYGRIDILMMTVLTALSVYNGQASVFYILYLFWWNEVLSVIIAKLFNKKDKRERNQIEKVFGLGSLFMLGIYWVFILVFFGFMANWKNPDIMLINFEVLSFRNIYFDLNLVFIVLQQCSYHIAHKNYQRPTSGFSPNMIVLHISIILGGIIMFFVVLRYPEVFTPDNLWGSICIISPFLLLRYFVQTAVLRNQSIEK